LPKRKNRFGMLLGNKTADEIEAFGGSQEAWGIFFFLI
jgi:hypothetical protein